MGVVAQVQLDVVLTDCERMSDHHLVVPHNTLTPCCNSNNSNTNHHYTLTTSLNSSGQPVKGVQRKA